MDTGKMMLESDRRIQASKEVKLVFTTNNNFNVLDDEGNLKYNGSVIPLDCTCPSFIHLNPDKHMDSHGEFAKCKHLFKAIEVKEMQDRQENRLRNSIKIREDKRVLRGSLPKGWKRYDD